MDAVASGVAGVVANVDAVAVANVDAVAVANVDVVVVANGVFVGAVAVEVEVGVGFSERSSAARDRSGAVALDAAPKRRSRRADRVVRHSST